MKRYLAVLAIMAMVMGGCATLQTACEHGDVIKAKIRAALQVAQVGYPLVMTMAGTTTDQGVLYKVSLIDAALDLLGQLAYDLMCPGPVELAQADRALDEVQEAKTSLGVK